MLLGLLDRVLVPLATHCSAKALSQFFITNVANIMTTLQARFTKVSNAYRILSKYFRTVRVFILQYLPFASVCQVCF